MRGYVDDVLLLNMLILEYMQMLKSDTQNRKHVCAEKQHSVHVYANENRVSVHVYAL